MPAVLGRDLLVMLVVFGLSLLYVFYSQRTALRAAHAAGTLDGSALVQRWIKGAPGDDEGRCGKLAPALVMAFAANARGAEELRVSPELERCVTRGLDFLAKTTVLQPAPVSIVFEFSLICWSMKINSSSESFQLLMSSPSAYSFCCNVLP